MKTAVTAIVITRNEEAAIERCVRALEFCDQIIVVDSESTDRTVEIARSSGAEVVLFSWNGAYPKKKQWGQDHPSVRNDWVLHVDGDEVITPALASEIATAVAAGVNFAAYDIPLSYYFMGRQLKHGHTVHKRSLVNRKLSKFPEVGDLDAPGITEVEGHYQPEVKGAIGVLSNRLVHDDPDPLGDWISRHNRYSDWEAYLATNPAVRRAVRGHRTKRGQAFDRVPLKPLIFFTYSYILKLGFLDGRAGFDYAYALAWYYWSISAKVRDVAQQSRQPR